MGRGIKPPESWFPLPDIDGDYINIILECEDIIENNSEKGYCPICGDQVDLETPLEKDYYHHRTWGDKNQNSFRKFDTP